MRASLLFNLLAAVGVLAVLIFGTSDSRAAFELVRASGALSLSNSKEGAAILSGHGLRPGARASGSVTIGNPSSAARRARARGRRRRGARAALGPALDLRQRRRAGRLRGPRRRLRPGRPRRAARGRAAGPTRSRAGSRTPTTRSRARGCRCASPGSPKPTPSRRRSLRSALPSRRRPHRPSRRGPSRRPRPRRPVSPAPDPNATVGAEQIVSLPSARACVSRRTIRIKVQAPRGVNVKSVTAKVNGRTRGSAKGARATITLRGLPRGTVRVQVTATLTNGRKVTLEAHLPHLRAIRAGGRILCCGGR